MKLQDLDKLIWAPCESELEFVGTATATAIDEPAELAYERKRRLAEWDRENS